VEAIKHVNMNPSLSAPEDPRSITQHRSPSRLVMDPSRRWSSRVSDGYSPLPLSIEDLYASGSHDSVRKQTNAMLSSQGLRRVEHHSATHLSLPLLIFSFFSCHQSHLDIAADPSRRGSSRVSDCYPPPASLDRGLICIRRIPHMIIPLAPLAQRFDVSSSA